jgi:hypothetical protein
MIKLAYLAASASLRVIGIVLTHKLQNPDANRKQGRVPEEMSQALLSKKKPQDSLTNKRRQHD